MFCIINQCTISHCKVYGEKIKFKVCIPRGQVRLKHLWNIWEEMTIWLTRLLVLILLLWQVWLVLIALISSKVYHGHGHLFCSPWSEFALKYFRKKGINESYNAHTCKSYCCRYKALTTVFHSVIRNMSYLPPLLLKCTKKNITMHTLY